MKLAIKGHYIRGEEVIESLEMLGGINVYNLNGDTTYYFYTITDNKEIDAVLFKCSDDKACIFSLEEFEEKYPYKVGDKVIIKVTNQEAIIDKVVWCCGTITYWLKYDGRLEGNWRAEHLQTYKEETMDGKYNVEKYLKVWGETEKGLEVLVNDNFELKEDNGKFYIIKKQPLYPKTYDECCKVLFPNTIELGKVSTHGYNGKLLEKFGELLICRDAYWKIANWKPDWISDKDACNSVKFCIKNFEDEIVRLETSESNTILAFPTTEIRDIFFENFKDLIEECKELL